jgi:hypothetical protein
LETNKWNGGNPSDNRLVLALAQEAGLNDALFFNTFGYVIARWNADAAEWRPIGFPSANVPQIAAALKVICWRELPAPPDGMTESAEDAASDGYFRYPPPSAKN